MNSPLTLSALGAYVVVTGALSVTNTFVIIGPRTLYVGGTSAGI